MFLEWLRTWPCWICFTRHCEKYNLNVVEFRASPACRALFLGLKSRWDCGRTEAAHMGPRGLGMRCPDNEAMPLGTWHHNRAGSGGGPEAHHVLGKGFDAHHNLDRREAFRVLRELYFQETGRTA